MTNAKVFVKRNDGLKPVDIDELTNDELDALMEVMTEKMAKQWVLFLTKWIRDFVKTTPQ